MRITAELRATKLRQLQESAGFESIEDMCAATITDAVAPGICMSEDCDYTTDSIEPDQRRGYCEACGKNTIVSCLVLAGFI